MPKIVFLALVACMISYYIGKSNGLRDHCYHDWQMAPMTRQLGNGAVLWTCVKCHRTRIGL